MSGTSKAKYLTYPEILPETDIEKLRNVYCYFIDHYGTTGIGVLIQKIQDEYAIIYGDWSGNTIDINNGTNTAQYALEFTDKYLLQILQILSQIKLPQAQLYLSTQNNELTLVDIQISLNKFLGPGMIRDIFSRIIKTQEIQKIDTVTKDTESHHKNTILKPSRFRINDDTQPYVPLYVEIK